MELKHYTWPCRLVSFNFIRVSFHTDCLPWQKLTQKIASDTADPVSTSIRVASPATDPCICIELTAALVALLGWWVSDISRTGLSYRLAS